MLEWAEGAEVWGLSSGFSGSDFRLVCVFKGFKVSISMDFPVLWVDLRFNFLMCGLSSFDNKE